MRVLAIDTALGQCGACILETDDPEPLSAESLAMERGHAEALLPLIDRVVSRVEGSFSSLDLVAVTIGPGSFTGLRVGIAAARAIGLAVPCPVVGVTTLSALMAPILEDAPRRLVVAAIDARGGRVYAQAIAASGRLIIPPSVLTIREVVRSLGSGPVIVVGSGAAAIVTDAVAVGVDARVHPALPVPDLAWVARLGAVADPDEALPRPLYLVSPDARPQDGARLPLQ
ncbi:tRNA (adenosine(37)-N6)-threonylcarbamoyltransferase complex dimerization subunit type 1 TsaB [uncultured Enterovirga sp.]|uniref:tRNA (adenosine(37)-N6)-threonylcarbamoyltransferase complex dimerization subunit type 1 TsaB n=1 Tax=uncultured Enterovirga sp. TaxID=2026352 RepID=UPI0035CAB4B5